MNNDVCRSCGIAYEFHDGVSVLCANLTAARAEVERLKAQYERDGNALFDARRERDARPTVEEVAAWTDSLSGRTASAWIDDPTYGLAAFIARTRKEKA